MVNKRIVFWSLPVLCLLFTGCGKNGATLSQLTSIQKALANAQPSTVQTAQNLSTSSLPALLTALSQNSSLSSSQSSVLANSQNQQILQGIIQLVAGGGTGSSELSALSSVLSAGGGLSNLSGPIGDILQVFTDIAPLISTFDPAIAPYITVALDVLPLVQDFLSVFAPASSTSSGH